MEFKHATSIAFSNFALVYKILLYLAVVTLIVAALASLILIPIFKNFIQGEQFLTLASKLPESIEKFMDGSQNIADTLDQLKVGITDLVKFVLSSGGFIAAVVCSCLFISLLFRILMTLCQLPVTDILNNFMSSNLKYGFLSNFAFNFRRSVYYSLANNLIMLPVNIVLFAILFFLGWGLFELIRFFMFPIIFVLAILLYTVRQTCFAGWLPRLVYHPEEGVWTALKNSFESVIKNRKELMMAYSTTFFIMYSMLAAFSIFTFGIALFVLPAFCYVILRTVELVVYYKNNSLKFYSDQLTIVDTVEIGHREGEQEQMDESANAVAIENILSDSETINQDKADNTKE